MLHRPYSIINKAFPREIGPREIVMGGKSCWQQWLVCWIDGLYIESLCGTHINSIRWQSSFSLTCEQLWIVQHERCINFNNHFTTHDLAQNMLTKVNSLMLGYQSSRTFSTVYLLFTPLSHFTVVLWGSQRGGTTRCAHSKNVCSPFFFVICDFQIEGDQGTCG